MSIVIAKSADINTGLMAEIFKDRRLQFSDRHGWDLFITDDGMEVDEYDDKSSEYIAAVMGGNHVASCRLRTTRQSTMLIDHFSDTFPEARGFLENQFGDLAEITRFCRSPKLSTHDTRQSLSYIQICLEGYRRKKNLLGFIAVVYSPVARLLRREGVDFLVISNSKIGGKTALLICILPLTDNSTRILQVT